MMTQILGEFTDRRPWILALVMLLILTSAVLGYFAPTRGLVLVLAVCVGAVLLQHPWLGVIGIVLSALVGHYEFSTGTEVALNPVTVMVPTALALGVIDRGRRREYQIASSRVNRPLMLFLLAGLFALLVGVVTWDPAVPRPDGFMIVQLGQWGIIALSATAFWVTANLVSTETRLRGLTLTYLALASTLAILRVVPGGASLARLFATHALRRAPFWSMLVAVTGGQLLFNQSLRIGWRLLSISGLAAALIYVFFLERATVSNWVGVAAVLGVLAWLRWPRLRWVAILILAALAVGGVLSSAVYDFAGGEAEWVESGGSRIVLIKRVIHVTMRNPVTGLGPAAYRLYARTKPLLYQRAYWVVPNVSSHNNYVDIYSHAGLLGLGVFVWFAFEVAVLGVRLRARHREGFVAGYVNAMLAAWAGSLVLMLFADWIIPFVYNVGFPGFQASVLIWSFLGGLVALEHMSSSRSSDTRGGKLGV